MKNLKIQFFSLICILLLIVVSGCGGSGGGSNNPPSGPTALNWQSLDNGIASYPAQGLSEIVVYQGIPYIACRETNIWLIKYDNDGTGVKWNPPYSVKINTDSQTAEGSPSLAFDKNNNPCLACKVTISGTGQGIGFWNYNNDVGRLAVKTITGGATAVEPCLSRNGSLLYFLSRDSSASDLTVSSLDDPASSWLGFTACNEICEAADLEVFNNYPYIAFKSLTGDLFVTKYSSSDGTWGRVGLSSVAADIGEFVFDIDSTGTVYTIFTNASGQVAVKKYTTSWETVGPAEYLFQGSADNVTIFIAGTTPYIAYRDVTNDQIKVRKFANNAWLELGSFTSDVVGESLPTPLDLSLYVDGNVVYAAYMNPGNRAAVKKGQ